MNVTLNHNVDTGDDWKLTPAQIVVLIEQVGRTVLAQSTKAKAWKKALSRAADLVAVAVAGGDEPFGKIARRMMGKPTPLAVLPAGTANNIAKRLGLSD